MESTEFGSDFGPHIITLNSNFWGLCCKKNNKQTNKKNSLEP